MYSPYAHVATTRDVLQRFSLHTTKALGQNFLVNDDIIGRIVRLADISKKDIVLEVGPGIGTLTYALCERAKRVVSIERDKRLPEVLAHTLAKFYNFDLISADAMKVDAQDLPAMPTKFVANLPYAVAATLVLRYFQDMPQLQSATVMVQREVAQRMAAEPGNKNYGAYTVKLRLYAQAVSTFDVSPGNFFPPPHVTSTVIKLERKTLEGAPGKEVLNLAAVLADAAFAQRRKTIYNSMKSFAAGNNILSELGLQNPERLLALFDKVGISQNVRAEVLEYDVFLNMAHALIS